jgi:ribonuclease Z
MEIVFLGTSSMVPTADRNHPAILLNYKAEHILVDCGEGTQRQFRKAKISPAKITKLLITHWHGDHVLGIPGLLQTLIQSNYSKTLEIYGPKGTKSYFSKMMDAFDIRGHMINYKIKEIKGGKIFDDKEFYLEAFRLDHGSCYGYNFIEKDRRKINLKKFGLKSDPILKKLQEGKDIIWEGKKIKAKDATTLVKGKKVCIVSDTGKCDNITKFGKNSDLMICEATLMHELKDIAKERKHLTSVQAAECAKKAKVKSLILTHFSQRYNDVKYLLKEAKAKFKETKAASDFLKISL